MEQPNDRRNYDPRVLALIDRLEGLIANVSRVTSDVLELQRKVDKFEAEQKRALKDVDDHETTLKTFNAFILETKMMHKSFDDFIKAQTDTNKLFMEAQNKTTKFQNNILMLGGAAWLLWQMFGSKLFSAAEVLMK